MLFLSERKHTSLYVCITRNILWNIDATYCHIRLNVFRQTSCEFSFLFCSTGRWWNAVPIIFSNIPVFQNVLHCKIYWKNLCSILSNIGYFKRTFRYFITQPQKNICKGYPEPLQIFFCGCMIKYRRVLPKEPVMKSDIAHDHDGHVAAVRWGVHLDVRGRTPRNYYMCHAHRLHPARLEERPESDEIQPTS